MLNPINLNGQITDGDSISFNQFKRGFNFNPNFITAIVFLVLSMATDLLHNHSVAWLLYFAYFSYLKTEN